MSRLENPRFAERTSIHTFSNTLGTDVFFVDPRQNPGMKSPDFQLQPYFQLKSAIFTASPRLFQLKSHIFYNFSRFLCPVFQLFQLKSPHFFTVDIC